jgi:hypothetical protein
MASPLSSSHPFFGLILLERYAMNAVTLETKFARMGARMKLQEMRRRDRGPSFAPLTLDVQSDAKGEFFDIHVSPDADVELDVIDLRRREQHLLLRSKERSGAHLYLCGHDERHWFVAGIPERAQSVRDVFTAMEALKPPEVIEAQCRQGLKGKEKHSRKNAAFVRQGEWFFIPEPSLRVEKMFVLFNEPLSRGNGSKPHNCEFLYRIGGQAVYVCDEYPQGLLAPAYSALLREKPRAKGWNWRRMQRNPTAYAKGKITHPDHKTIELFVWHRILMNTEGQSRAMRNVVFLD